jgi:hypothetical protein
MILSYLSLQTSMQVQILLLKKIKINLDSNEFGSLYLVGRTCHPRNEKQKSTKKIAIKEFLLLIIWNCLNAAGKFYFYMIPS